MTDPVLSCDDLAKAYWDAVAAHGENSDEANEALGNWQFQCSTPGDNSGGTSKPPKSPG